MNKFLFLSLLLLNKLNWISSVYWQKDDWAFACDFKNNDFKNVKSQSSYCGPLCLADPVCTHFTWTDYNGGTCWMKKNTVSKSNAFDTNNYNMVCGILLWKMNNNSSAQVVWSEEFNYYGKPSSEWTQEIGNGNNGWGNQEAQYYTDFNANSDGQFLNILSERKDYNGFRYTSSRLISKRNFTYGVIEMRAKLPKGRGVWPAFWLLSANRPLNWPSDGEIDIMEHVGWDVNNIHAAIHCKSFFAGSCITSKININDPYNTFHTYKLDWNSKRLRIYVDDKEYFYYPNDNKNNKDTWPFNGPMNIILNNAVGGSWGGQYGIDDSIFPTKYVIDYVRVYAANNNS